MLDAIAFMYATQRTAELARSARPVRSGPGAAVRRRTRGRRAD